MKWYIPGLRKKIKFIVMLSKISPDIFQVNLQDLNRIKGKIFNQQIKRLRMTFKAGQCNVTLMWANETKIENDVRL